MVEHGILSRDLIFTGPSEAYPQVTPSPRSVRRGSWTGILLVGLVGACGTGGAIPMSYRDGPYEQYATLYNPARPASVGAQKTGAGATSGAQAAGSAVRGPVVVGFMAAFSGMTGRPGSWRKKCPGEACRRRYPAIAARKRGLDGERSEGRLTSAAARSKMCLSSEHCANGRT